MRAYYHFRKRFRWRDGTQKFFKKIKKGVDVFPALCYYIIVRRDKSPRRKEKKKMFEMKLYMVATDEYKTLARFFSIEGAAEYSLTVDSTVEVFRKGKVVARFFKGEAA